MRWTRPLQLVVVCVFTTAASLASAQTLERVDRGWYQSSGTHQATNENYIVGDASLLFRNFFVYDLSTVTDVITGATLVLQMPPAGYSSPDPTETYELYQVTTPPEDLILGIPISQIYDDLGSGPTYADVELSTKDNGTLVQIPLNQTALDDLNSTNGLFAIGGAITTLGLGIPQEFAFGFTNDGTEVTKLVLETAPAECFLVIGNGPAQSTFATGLHTWTTQVGMVEDFYLVSLQDFPEFVLPVDRIPGPKTRRSPRYEPEPKKLRPHLPAPNAPDATGELTPPSSNTVRTWMQDRTFSAQVVLWNPGEFPDQPEQTSHPLLVRIRPDGRIVTIPYGSGTGMEVWAETGIDEDGNTVVRFPFTIPGL